MKKIYFTLVSLVLVSSTYAHDFWVDGYNSSTFKAHIGYGHGFPHPEKIAEDKLDIFESLVILDKDLKNIVLKSKGENYQHNTKNSLEDGTYILKGSTKNVYWTKTKDNKWEMGKTKQDIKDAQYCDQVSKFSKSIINIGDDDNLFVTKPIGEKFEIIPLDNPANFKVGEPFKVQVLLDGKPAKTIKIKGTFASNTKHQFAFYGTTDLRGKIEITPLRGGKWILMTESTRALKNTTKCDNEFNYATLVFNIK